MIEPGAMDGGELVVVARLEPYISNLCASAAPLGEIVRVGDVISMDHSNKSALDDRARNKFP